VRLLQASGDTLPERIILCAPATHPGQRLRGPARRLLKRSCWAFLRVLGDTPNEALSDPALTDLLLAGVREA
jgi:hypothetical protein